MFPRPLSLYLCHICIGRMSMIKKGTERVGERQARGGRRAEEGRSVNRTSRNGMVGRVGGLDGGISPVEMDGADGRLAVGGMKLRKEGGREKGKVSVHTTSVNLLPDRKSSSSKLRCTKYLSFKIFFGGT